jgi:hypothetical protein
LEDRKLRSLEDEGKRYALCPMPYAPCPMPTNPTNLINKTIPTISTFYPYIGEYKMIIKNDIFELEISEGVGVYFGSKASGQHFKKWEEFKEEEKQQIELIQHTVENLLKTSEKTFMTDSNKWTKESI